MFSFYFDIVILVISHFGFAGRFNKLGYLTMSLKNQEVPQSILASGSFFLEDLVIEDG